MSKKLIAKTVARTLVYQLLIIWTSFSIGFLMNPEYWGNRAPVVNRSIKHIFWPIEYNSQVEDFCIKIGRSRIFFETSTEYPGFTDLKILEDGMNSDEWYFAKYEFKDNQGNLIRVNDFSSKVNWKPWELDYPPPNQKPVSGSRGF